MSGQGLGDGAVEEFLGGTPAENPEAYAAADPLELTPRVPVRILHGTADTVIPIVISERYATAHPAYVSRWSTVPITSPGATRPHRPGRTCSPRSAIRPRSQSET